MVDRIVQTMTTETLDADIATTTSDISFDFICVILLKSNFCKRVTSGMITLKTLKDMILTTTPTIKPIDTMIMA